MKYVYSTLALLFAAHCGATTLEINSSFEGFTNRAAFIQAIGDHQGWGFEELLAAGQPTNVLSADGQVVLTLAQSNPLPDSFFPPVTTLAGSGIYFNFAPQPKGEFVFPNGQQAFGISLVWAAGIAPNLYNPRGIGLEVYDAQDDLIGSVFVRKSQALAGPWFTTGGETYEGFLGFITTEKAASVRFVQLGGSVWYDNAVWASTQPLSAPIPEPSTVVLLALGLLGAALLVIKRRTTPSHSPW